MKHYVCEFCAMLSPEFLKQSLTAVEAETTDSDFWKDNWRYC